MKVDKAASFIHFAFPFLFNPDEFKGLAEAIGGSEGVWERLKFPEEDLLAHVREYLNPQDEKQPTAYLWKLSDELREDFGFADRAEWFLCVGERIKIPFQFGEVGKNCFAVQLTLFRVGVGFLTIRIKLHTENLGDWLDCIHYFHFVRGQRDVWIEGRRRVGKDMFEPFFPERAKQRQPEGAKQNFGQIIDAILLTASPKGEKWWHSVFIEGQLLPYAALFVDGASDDEIPQILYRVCNFFPSRRPIKPSREDPSFNYLLPYAERQWFVCALEGGAFIAFDAPDTDFFRRELPKHLEQHYFLLFLLVQHQRFALMRISQEISEHWLKGDERERVKTFENVRNNLLDFTARGYFMQVMQREHHHRVYRRWQEVLQIEQLYREVNDEVREMHEYLQARQMRKLEQRINALSAFIGIPALVFGFFSINLYGITAKGEGLSLGFALGLAALSFLSGFLIWLWLSRK